MKFTSLEFVLFFVVFFFLYWFVFNRNSKSQNIFLLLGNYLFFAWWDWRFLSLLIGSSIINYVLGIHINKTTIEKRRSFLILIGLVANLGVLVFFKYYNFFAASLSDGFAAINIQIHLSSLNLLLPLGISFYTFRAISYLLDIDNETIEPAKDWVAFFAYLSFFPTLLAGPIDRAKHFIPQLLVKRTFDYDQASGGLRKILWGLFKKVVIADNCVLLTNYIFNNYTDLPSSTLLIGSFLYCIQVYADFSGYSDMAIGVADLLGIRISKNFNFPFFAQNIAEFWQRWHMSLTSWMQDYVFTPLSFVFRKQKKAGLILAIIINFTLVGLWHGANWTFIVFGFLQGCYFIPLILKGTLNKKKVIASDSSVARVKIITNTLGTFILVMLTTIIFRADNLFLAIDYYKRLFDVSTLFSKPITNDGITMIVTLVFILLMFAIEWLQRKKDYVLQITAIKKRPLRIAIYYVLAIVIFIFRANETNQFIYFQF
jgi:alginate O-acetyltransferase complex protein AlgI